MKIDWRDVIESQKRARLFHRKRKLENLSEQGLVFCKKHKYLIGPYEINKEVCYGKDDKNCEYLEVLNEL